MTQADLDRGRTGPGPAGCSIDLLYPLIPGAPAFYMSNRTYSKDEAAALLRRTVELHAARGQRNPANGLTLEELEAVAAESGLDPALLRQAADEFNDPHRLSDDEAHGSDATHIYIERRILNPLDDDAWYDAVAELRHRYGEGSEGISTRTRSWGHTSASGIETRVLVRPQGDGMHVRLSQRVGIASTPTESVMYGGILALLVAGVAGGVASSEPVGITVLLAGLLTLIPLVYWLDTVWRRKKHRELNALADRVASILTVPVAAEAAPLPVKDPVPEAPTSAAPSLNGPLHDAYDEAAEGRASQRARTR
ncbi:MAG: hypothetical protein AAF970_10650 [Bacteroidota bacterium]